MRRKEPKTVPRPSSSVALAVKRFSGSSQAPQADPEQAAPQMSGHRQMLMAAMQRGMVRSG